MTVIVWDGTTLAADSRVTSASHLVSDDHDKIISLKTTTAEYRGDKLLAIGMAGLLADYDKVMSMIFTDNFGYEDLGIDHEIDAILVGEKNVYNLESGKSFLIRYNRSVKLAVGSGEPFAMVALKQGKNAKQAVKVAMSLDCGCGGDIKSMTFK